MTDLEVAALSKRLEPRVNELAQKHVEAAHARAQANPQPVVSGGFGPGGPVVAGFPGQAQVSQILLAILPEIVQMITEELKGLGGQTTNP